MNIRRATLKDLDQITEIEAACFPQAEAATRESLQSRIKTFADGFYVIESNEEVVGFINGAAFNSMTIADEYFSDMNHHSESGTTLAVFGLDVHPNHQHNGYARKLMNTFIDYATASKRQYVILTCKEHLLHYYETFGFKNSGVSESSHGGAKWYDMTLTL